MRTPTSCRSGRDPRYGFDVDLFPSSPGGPATRYYPPRWKLLAMALACFGVCAILLVPARSIDRPVVAGTCWVVITLVAAAGLVLGWRAVRPGPTVVIDGQGITDRTTLAPIGLVRWEEITVIRKREIGHGMGTERMLEIMLNDPAAFHSQRRGWLQRATYGVRRALRQPQVCVPGSMVAVPMQVVIDEIRQRRPSLQVLEGPPPAPPKLQAFRRRRPQTGRQHPDMPRW